MKFIVVDNKRRESVVFDKGILDLDRRKVNKIYQNNKELLDPYTTIMKIMTQGQNNITSLIK